jgi:sugar/nucleoside kinase (ribokinase family)
MVRTQAGTKTRPTILVVGEAITAFMHYPTDAPLAFHGPFPSGAPVIFASAAARLGAHVELAAGVGDDMFGAQFKERLAAHGVSTRCLVVDPLAPTAAVFVTYEADGTRSFMFHLEGTAGLQVDAAALDRAAPADWLHVSGATLWFGGPLGATTWLAVERAIAAGTPISFDPNVRATELSPEVRRQFDILLGVARVVLASAGELEALGGSEAAIVERGGAVCYKTGAAGATVVTTAGRWSVPAPKATEVDPDGAGDIFAAGYVVAAALGAEPQDCARVGVAVASASVEVKGPLESTILPIERYLDPGAAGA